MSRVLGALALALLMSGCGGDFSAPRNLDNACSIVDQRPNYLAAMRRTERNWGVPVAVQMATIHQESKFVGNARTPHTYALGIIPMGRMSSAYGYSQAIDGTWEDYRRSTGRRGAKRDNIRDATDFMGWYMDQTQRRLGIAKGDAQNQYLAYHEGHGGYASGSHFRKDWLMGVSARVATRAKVYNDQLLACRRI